MTNKSSAKNTLIVLFLIMCFLSAVSCGLFGGDVTTCGNKGELELKNGKDFQYYCHINTLFRDNSVIFDSNNNVLLINLYGTIFDGDVSKKTMREVSQKTNYIFELSEKVTEEKIFFEEKVEDEKTNTQEKDYKIKGQRHLLIQVPFKGTGVYSSDKVYLIMFENDKEKLVHTPKSTETNIIFNISNFTINSLSEQDLEKPQYKGINKDMLKVVKKLHITGKIMGQYPNKDGETINLNGSLNFNTTIDIPENLDISKLK